MDVIPAFRFRDAHAAIAFLTDALGFERHAVHDDGSGGVGHAELRFGDGMVMLGSAREEGAELHGDLGACSTYLVADDDALDAAYERARAAGAEVLRELQSEDYGGRGFTVADPEGNRWTLGSYRPA